MKVSEEFKKVIKAHLDGVAAEDALFAISYAKEGKNLESCCNYILNEVQKSECNGFADEEVFSLALHYYDEDNITEEECTPIDGRVVVNHHVELSEEEKAQARKDAIAQYRQQVVAEAKRKESEKAKKDKERKEKFAAQQLSLFDS